MSKFYNCLHKRSAVHWNAKTREKHFNLFYWAGVDHLSQKLYFISTKQISTIFQVVYKARVNNRLYQGVFLDVQLELGPHDSILQQKKKKRSTHWCTKTPGCCGWTAKNEEKEDGFSNLLTLGHGHCLGQYLVLPAKGPQRFPALQGRLNLDFTVWSHQRLK